MMNIKTLKSFKRTVKLLRKIKRPPPFTMTFIVEETAAMTRLMGEWLSFVCAGKSIPAYQLKDGGPGNILTEPSFEPNVSYDYSLLNSVTTVDPKLKVKDAHPSFKLCDVDIVHLVKYRLWEEMKDIEGDSVQDIFIKYLLMKNKFIKDDPEENTREERNMMAITFYLNRQLATGFSMWDVVVNPHLQERASNFTTINQFVDRILDSELHLMYKMCVARGVFRFRKSILRWPELEQCIKRFDEQKFESKATKLSIK